ncbi:S-adenosyl-L-methionine-dependent methyltransferase [Dipodascopsis tothii]|uniref:S-adenosyl-L-methionine-dependent methyltransferase n=1 Tax=Dipodascopsis tothii TaxID=44089 RepID=UPI0034CDC589
MAAEGAPVTIPSSANGTQFVIEPRAEPFEGVHEVVAEIRMLGSNGDGIGVYTPEGGAPTAIVVPFTLPGDRVRARVYRRTPFYAGADFVAVESPAAGRDDTLVSCKYFAKCSGCQLQMSPYADQLAHKREVIERAYRHFCKVPAGRVPAIGDTVGSPLEHGYRTKLTPHFDAPRNKAAVAAADVNIGFMERGRNRVLDIEECALGTPVLNTELTARREHVRTNLHTYKRGATVLLRETGGPGEPKTAETDPKAIVTETVGEYTFQYPAGAFFQCNNSVLPLVTSYVRDNLALPAGGKAVPPKYLVDAYCGSGLFSITCSPGVDKVVGVEIAADSVRHAVTNARANNITNAEFIVGDANVIFAQIEFPPAETSIILDPPRKGCDHKFLDQLLAFLPRRIVYISCNVHTQARDLGYLLNHPVGTRYAIDSIRGFDFFPQTHHVESVAVLTLAD